MLFIALLIPLILFAIIRKFTKNRTLETLANKHVVITGGSSGIGKSVAILAAKMGAHVTIIARNQLRLDEAENEIRTACINTGQKITTVSSDVSQRETITKELYKLEDQVGPIYVLVNCAGTAICGKVEEFSETDVRTLIEANFLGTLYPIQALVPKFKKRQAGIIVLTASQVALMGMFGYSVYSSCKFALRGLAESISMELKPYNVSVTLALPPDTDTPGFAAENRTKPRETQLMSESAGLVQPERVAKKMLEDALAGNFFSYVGFESRVLTTLCVGMSPASSLLEVLFQSVVLGPLRLVGAYYLTMFDKIVQKCHDEDKKIQ